MNNEIVTATLVSEVTKTSVSTIFDKIDLIKKRGNNERTIAELSDLINIIINEREEIYKIARKHEEELYSKTISDEDIEFILNSIFPIIEKYSDFEAMEDVKTLLSSEVIKVMQIIGFDVRNAIGIPLTKLVANLIEGRNDNTSLKLENELLLKKLILNEETREITRTLYDI